MGTRDQGSDLHVGPDDGIVPRGRRSKKDSRPANQAVSKRRSIFASFFSRKPKAESKESERQPKEKKTEEKTNARRKKPRRRRSITGMFFYWSFVMSIWALVAGAGVIAYHASKLPPIDQLAVPKRPPNIAIMAENGALLANRGDTGGAAIHLRELPPYAPKAFIAIEDRRFYSHWGLDVMGIGRALLRNVTKSGGAMEGGSSITQQLAKNLFLTQERTMSRKIQEAILSVWLERKYSKDQIIELYLNRVYFGSGAYGIEAAAQRYYGKSARQLTLPESAVLAGLMKAPSRLAPNKNPEGAATRAAQVITAMAREGHITEAMAKLALSRPAMPKKEQGSGSINYVADYVMDILDDTVGAFDTDIVVTTTIDPTLQSVGEKALAEVLSRNGDKLNVEQGALVAMTPGGEIKALVGGRDYSESQFNRATAAKRQPGSAFKPFVFLTAIERGYRPDSRVLDAPVNVKGWRPENSSREFFGEVTLTRALSLSLNTVSVRLGMATGPAAVVATAHRLGITSPLQTNASIALGTSEVSPLELVGAYAPFANGGIRIQPHIITQIKKSNGQVIYRRKGTSFGRVVEPQYVAMMNAMMQETLLTGTARKAELPGWQAAGKTGTSQEYRDGWFVGYTSHMVAGVWLGNDDSSATKRVSGGNLPVDIWSRFMKEAHKGLPPQYLPSGTWSDPARSTPPPIPPAEVAPSPMASAPAAAVRPVAQETRPSGAPISINPSGRAFEQAERRAPASPPRSINDLLPPAPIGQVKPAPIPQQDRNLLQRMFGD
jgi:penicillin-binding protein 1A